jgi:rhodanese-related sulfurtransferase
MQTIDRESLKRTLDKGSELTVLNVLPEDAYKKEHIKGSDNISVQDENFEEEVENKVGAKDKPIVVYCASNECPASKNAAVKLEQAGFTNVRAYEGGMQDWKDANYPVEGTA